LMIFGVAYPGALGFGLVAIGVIGIALLVRAYTLRTGGLDLAGRRPLHPATPARPHGHQHRLDGDGACFARDGTRTLVGSPTCAVGPLRDVGHGASLRP